MESATGRFWGLKEIVAKWQGDEAAAEEAKSTQSVNVLQEVTGHKLDRTLDLCELLSGTGSLMKSLKGASAAEKLINALEKIRSAFGKLKSAGKHKAIAACTVSAAKRNLGYAK